MTTNATHTWALAQELQEAEASIAPARALEAIALELEREAQASTYRRIAVLARAARLPSTLASEGAPHSEIAAAHAAIEQAERLASDYTRRDRVADRDEHALAPRDSACVAGSPRAFTREDYQHMRLGDGLGRKEVQDWASRPIQTPESATRASEAARLALAEQEAEREAVSSDIARRCQLAARKAGKRGRGPRKAGNPESRLRLALGIPKTE